MSVAMVTRHSRAKGSSYRCPYVTDHSTQAGQFNRQTPRLFLVKGDKAASKLNRHALDSELTEGMRASLLSQPASLLLFMPWFGSGAAVCPLSPYLR